MKRSNAQPEFFLSFAGSVKSHWTSWLYLADCGWLRNLNRQLIDGKHPIIYRVLSASEVVQGFSTIQSISNIIPTLNLVLLLSINLADQHPQIVPVRQPHQFRPEEKNNRAFNGMHWWTPVFRWWFRIIVPWFFFPYFFPCSHSFFTSCSNHFFPSDCPIFVPNLFFPSLSHHIPILVPSCFPAMKNCSTWQAMPMGSQGQVFMGMQPMMSRLTQGMRPYPFFLGALGPVVSLIYNPGSLGPDRMG